MVKPKPFTNEQKNNYTAIAISMGIKFAIEDYIAENNIKFGEIENACVKNGVNKTYLREIWVGNELFPVDVLAIILRAIGATFKMSLLKAQEEK